MPTYTVLFNFCGSKKKLNGCPPAWIIVLVYPEIKDQNSPLIFVGLKIIFVFWKIFNEINNMQINPTIVLILSVEINGEPA